MTTSVADHLPHLLPLTDFTIGFGYGYVIWEGFGGIRRSWSRWEKVGEREIGRRDKISKDQGPKVTG